MKWQELVQEVVLVEIRWVFLGTGGFPREWCWGAAPSPPCLPDPVVLLPVELKNTKDWNLRHAQNYVVFLVVKSRDPLTVDCEVHPSPCLPSCIFLVGCVFVVFFFFS